MRIPFYVALVVAIAVGGGGASVWFALNAIDGLDTLTVGAWTAYPESGTPQVDPYGRARIARDGGRRKDEMWQTTTRRGRKKAMWQKGFSGKKSMDEA